MPDHHEQQLTTRSQLDAAMPALHLGTGMKPARHRLDPDAAWRRIVVVLALAGCSQPHAREAPPPRPRDAPAPVLIDGSIVDAPPSPADADTAQHKVAWQLLRENEPTPSLRVGARLRQVEPASGEVLVIFDRGTDAGVAVGWRGRLLDSGDHRVFDVFEITKADRHACQAQIKASFDQVVSRSEHAVLWDPAEPEP